jgi:peptidoglycan-N-acetylglucosamine deacetylase
MPSTTQTSSARCRRLVLCAGVLTAVALLVAPRPAAAPDRRMAITIDDLPFSAAGTLPPDEVDARTDRLLATLRAHKVTAIGFVNEGAMEDAAIRERQIRRLTRWLDAGMPLGNHTFSHRSLSTTPVADYEADVLRGEAVTRPLMAARGLTEAWFRHPFTHTGPTLEVRARFEQFLTKQGYRIAPFTIEQSDFVFDKVRRGLNPATDAETIARLHRDYLDYNDTMTAWFETVSMKVFGREVPQTLLIHANTINAEQLDAMLTRVEARGYRFVTLEEAMQDEAYRTEDRFVGTFGPSWLHRWGIARGIPVSMRDEPDPPKWVIERYHAK